MSKSAKGCCFNNEAGVCLGLLMEFQSKHELPLQWKIYYKTGFALVAAVCQTSRRPFSRLSIGSFNNHT